MGYTEKKSTFLRNARVGVLITFKKVVDFILELKYNFATCFIIKPILEQEILLNGVKSQW